MSICFIPSGPSVRSEYLRATATDTSVFSIRPRASHPVSARQSARLNAGLLRGIPWSEAGHAGRLTRSTLAGRFGVPCYAGDGEVPADNPADNLAAFGMAARRGSSGESSDPGEATPSQFGDPKATIDMTIQADLVGPVGLGEDDVLFLSCDVLFDPAFRAVDPDGPEGVASVSNFQDLVGVAMAPQPGGAAAVRVLPEASTPPAVQDTLRRASVQSMDEDGTVSVRPAGPAGLIPCAENGQIFANRIASSTAGDDFDLGLTTMSPVSRAGGQAERRSGGGLCWLSGLRVMGGLSAPMPYDVARPGCLASLSNAAPRLRRLPIEATSGIDLSYGAAFAIDAGRLGRRDARIDLLAVQRMVSLDVDATGTMRLTANLFLASARVVLRYSSGGVPRIGVTRRCCWGTDLRHCSDAVGPAVLRRAVPGQSWHA